MNRSSKRSHLRRLVSVYEGARAIQTGEKFTTVNELTDQLPATRADTLLAAVSELIRLGPLLGTKILSEEDKGAAMAGVFSVMTGLPLAMARYYPYHIPGAVEVPFEMEYMKGYLTVNGVKAGDRLIIVDDTLATGGTAVSIGKAAKAMGAEVVEMRVVVEKLGYGGRERIQRELGIAAQAVIGISITDGVVSVDEILEVKRA